MCCFAGVNVSRKYPTVANFAFGQRVAVAVVYLLTPRTHPKIIYAPIRTSQPFLVPPPRAARFPSGCSTSRTNIRGKIFALEGDKSCPLPPSSTAQSPAYRPPASPTGRAVAIRTRTRLFRERVKKVSSGNASPWRGLDRLRKTVIGCIRVVLVCGTNRARNVLFAMLCFREFYGLCAEGIRMCNTCMYILHALLSRSSPAFDGCGKRKCLTIRRCIQRATPTRCRTSESDDIFHDISRVMLASKCKIANRSRVLLFFSVLLFPIIYNLMHFAS